MSDWYAYQKEVASFFRSLGVDAVVDETVKGVRTNHNVDVVVRGKLGGIEVLWLVECKLWKSAVPKEKVQVLKQIVQETGADRGFLMAENGYQSGALEAALFANVSLTSLRDLRETLAYDVGMNRLRDIIRRHNDGADRYFALDTQDRIDHELHPESGGGGYQGRAVLKAVEHTVHQAMYYGFPLPYDRMNAALSAYAGGLRPDSDIPGDFPGLVRSPVDLCEVLGAELAELEAKLDVAEAAVAERRRTSDS